MTTNPPLPPAGEGRGEGLSIPRVRIPADQRPKADWIDVTALPRPAVTLSQPGTFEHGQYGGLIERRVGNVSIPQEAFIAALKMEDEN